MAVTENAWYNDNPEVVNIDIANKIGHLPDNDAFNMVRIDGVADISGNIDGHAFNQIQSNSS